MPVCTIQTIVYYGCIVIWVKLYVKSCLGEYYNYICVVK